jgi:AcrR family transcriptional regulator
VTEVSVPVRPGRPRSEPAWRAVLEAVDDLLVEVGYAAMTIKGIAERAGVSRQTVYRWWSTKAEILLEACVEDAAEELATRPRPDPVEDLCSYVKALTRFLTGSPAGLAYRALVGEAQHDHTVRELVAGADVLGPTTRAVLARVRPVAPAMPEPALASAQLTGPVLSQVLAAPVPLSARSLRTHVTTLLAAWQQPLPAARPARR